MQFGPTVEQDGVYSTWMVILIELMYLSSWSFFHFLDPSHDEVQGCVAFASTYPCSHHFSLIPLPQLENASSATHSCAITYTSSPQSPPHALHTPSSKSTSNKTNHQHPHRKTHPQKTHLMKSPQTRQNTPPNPTRKAPLIHIPRRRNPHPRPGIKRHQLLIQPLTKPLRQTRPRPSPPHAPANAAGYPHPPATATPGSSPAGSGPDSAPATPPRSAPP